MDFAFKRKHFFSRWWKEIDTIFLMMVFALIFTGAMLITTASTSVAEHLGMGSFYFVKKQSIYLLLAIFLICTISCLPEKSVKKICLIGFMLTLITLIAVLFIGEEVKGAKRWLNLLGLSIQPSEFLKPFYTVIMAVILSEKNTKENFSGFTIAILLHVLIITLLILQPDFGMMMTVSLTTAIQFFIAGLSITWIIIMAIILILGISVAYITMSHVAKRINTFINSEDLSYQVEKSIDCYIKGGFFGSGPGEGQIKSVLPDSHTDFIFAVASEEFGAIFCIALVLLFALIVLRGIKRSIALRNLFHIYSCIGLLMYLGIQSMFNIGVSLNILPTKGMTLPFISYGGSSTISFALIIGMYLNFSKNRENQLLSMKYPI